MLKVLEGETEQVIQRDWLRERERILPDLAANIQCGNSLIGPDFYHDPQMLLLDEDAQYRVNAFDWSGAFPDVMRNGGFHCVMSNPPYGAVLGKEEKDYLMRAYNCQSYQLDSYLLFLERTLTTLQRSGGRSGFIIPNPWLTNLKQAMTRRFVCDTAAIEQIVHFGFSVFKTAIVDTEIVLFSTPRSPSHTVDVFECDRLGAGGTLHLRKVAEHSQRDWIALDGGVINIFMTARDKQLFAKLVAQSRPLEHWFKINVGIKPYQTGKGSPPQTSKVVDERPFDSNSKRDATYRELLRGGDINRYAICPTESRFISYGPWLAEPRPAAGFDVPQKILIRQTGDRPIAALDTQRRLAMNNIHVAAPKSGLDVDIRYFLGVLNSTVATWFYRCLNPEAGEALAEVKRANVAAVAIKDVKLNELDDVAVYEKIVAVASSMLAFQQEFGEARSPNSRRQVEKLFDAADRQMNMLVYELFGLNHEEIGIIESGLSGAGSSGEREEDLFA